MRAKAALLLEKWSVFGRTIQAGCFCKVLRAADRYAYTGCGSTACSVGTIYGGKRDLCTPDARPALLATLSLTSLATPCSPYQTDNRYAAYSQRKAVVG